MTSKENKLDWLDLFVGGLVISIILFFSLWLYPWTQVITQDWNRIQNSNSATVNEKDKFNASLEIIKAIVGGVGTVATVAGGFVLYFNFRVANHNAEIANRNAEIANRNAEIAESRLITERFSKAVEQLGSDKLEVCLGGIYSLEKIATDSANYYRTIIEVLTAFIREMSLVDESRNSARNSSTHRSAIQTTLTVIGRRNLSQDPPDKLLDLRYAKLSQFNINGNFSRVDFRSSELNSADLKGSNFSNSDFSNSSLLKADLRGSDFSNSNFRDANLKYVDLTQAILKNATLTDANLNFTIIIDGDLAGAKLNKTFLYTADLRNSDLQDVDLSYAHIREAIFVNVDLTRSNFSNTIFWDFDKWENRHFTEEERLECEYHQSEYEYHQEQERRNNPALYDYEELPTWKWEWESDFRLAKGLTIEQIRAANNFAKAIYDDSLRQQLNLPEYQPDKIRRFPKIPDINPPDN